MVPVLPAPKDGIRQSTAANLPGANLAPFYSILQTFMDRSAAIAKIRAMITLRKSTTFEGESAAATAAINRLCLRYDLDVIGDVVVAWHKPTKECEKLFNLID
jgi:hypothetical protein